MKSFMLVFLVFSIVGLTSCKHIYYKLEKNPELATLLRNLPDSMRHRYPPDFVNDKKVYVVIASDDNKVYLFFNYYEKNPYKEIEKLIKSSNRFLVVDRRKIPVIFMYDLLSTILDNDSPQDPVPIKLGGYTVVIDGLYYQNIIPYKSYH